MATVYDLTTKMNGKGIHLFKYGYQKAPETALLMYDMEQLNSEKFDFRTQKLKNAASKVTLTPTGESLEWYEEDIKEETVGLTTATSATSFVVTSGNLFVGEQLYNQTTGTTVLVTAVSGTTITLGGAGDTSASDGDVLYRLNFAKKYGVDHGMSPTRNDMANYTNYIQFVETQIDSDMIENNKTRLFINSAEELYAHQFAECSRKMIKGMAGSFYFGKSSKTNVGGTPIYTAGGLDEYIPAANKVNIKGTDNTATKANLRTQLTAAYQSGVENVWGKNKLIFLCTTKFMDEIDSLYEDKLTYNDTLKNIDVNITSYSVGGKSLNMVCSNVLDEVYGDWAGGFLVPIDEIFLYMLPKTVASANSKAVETAGRGLVYQKPQSTPEKRTIALFTHYSFMFGNVSSGAYRKIWIA